MRILACAWAWACIGLAAQGCVVGTSGTGESSSSTGPDAAAAPGAPDARPYPAGPVDGGPVSPSASDGSSAIPDGSVPPREASPSPPPDAGDACATAAACEDFEGFGAGPLVLPDAGGTWQITTPDCSGTGALAIDATVARGGSRSLRVSGAAGYCNHVFLGTNAVAGLTGLVWGRFYVRLASPLTADHATFLALHDMQTNADLRMGGQDGVLMWNRASDDATLPAMSPAGTALSVVPSIAVWHCVEFEIDPAVPALQSWVDGALVTGLVVGGSAAVPAADGQWLNGQPWAPHLVDARFGWESYASEAETLWFDDLALGGARIGCE